MDPPLAGGVWLDAGELEELEIFFEKNKPEGNDLSFWDSFKSGLTSLFSSQP